MNSGPRHKHKKAVVEIPSAILEGWRLRHLPVRIVDVRSACEFAAGHLPGAVNHPLETLGPIAVAPGERLVLVCQGEARARMAAHRLAEFGIESYVLRGGTAGWNTEGRPLHYHAPASWSREQKFRLVAGVVVLLATLAAAFMSPKWLLAIAFVGICLIATALRDR